MIISWRITSGEYAATAFDGEGARLFGGRWNSTGVPLVYTSSSAALAALELLVRIRRREPLRRYVLFACSFDEGLMHEVERASLPPNWRAHPAPAALQAIGDRWTAARETAVLRVPSAIIETESNYLFNPAHPDFAQISVADPIPFGLDVRLLRG